MKSLVIWLVALVATLSLRAPAAHAEQHRATRLGNPATRFAPPLNTPEDLRSRFRDEKLRPDIASVLRQWGWQGDLADLYRAALTVQISDVKVPVGSTMPFMSSREAGKPICLRNVLWAGEKPAPAYAFNFVSKGRLYRCITPKACSNFYVVDLGAEPKPALALECVAPAEVLAARPVQVCLNARNIGDAPEPKATVTLAIPPEAAVVQASHNGVAAEGRVTWEIADFKSKDRMELCATLAAREPGSLPFQAAIDGQLSQEVRTSCSTRILGIPAILLELVDLEDPLQVGQHVTYEIKVTNQGSAPGTNVRIACKLPDSEEFVSGDGATPVRLEGGAVTAAILPELAPKAAATWRVIVKAAKAADARFRVELTSDQFRQAIEEEESTELY